MVVLTANLFVLDFQALVANLLGANKNSEKNH